MELGVLGALEARVDGTVLALPGGKPRTVLARLLIDTGQVVSIDALADALWGDSPPANIAPTIQVHVSHLRRCIGAETIATRPSGYAIAVEGNQFDHRLLEDLVDQARRSRSARRPDAALGQAQRAVALLRGQPYSDFGFEEWAQAEIVRLRNLSLQAHEERHAALLDLDRHREALPSLESLVEAHPFHERLRAQLMLALYRDGRQADALRRCAEGRRLLVDELGVGPGPELRQMEARVLAHDESLRPPPSRVVVRPHEAAPGEPVGRAKELSVLRAAWDEACAGGLRVVVIEGEPGTGKSTLARWSCQHARRDGAAVGTGTAHELSGAPPYWPWKQALRSVAQSEPERVRSAMVATPGASRVAVLVGEGGDVEPPSDDHRFELFDATERMLRRLAEQSPVLVVLEDLQWADQATLDLLRFLARSASSARTLVIATARTSVAGSAIATAVADIITEVAVVRIVIGPLDADGVRDLVERITGDTVEPPIAGAIARATGGNPFYVEELVRLLRTEDRGLDLSRAAVPDSVRAVVRRRAARLGEQAMELLTLGAFAGREFSEQVPRRMLPMDPAVLRTLLTAAVDDGLLQEVEGRPGHYRFAHDMARHAFYDAVPQQRRAETHLEMGRVLVELAGDRPDALVPEIATHFSNAVDVGGAAEAVEWLRLAAAQAIRSDAYTDALRHLRRALYVVRSRIVDDRLECEVLIEVAAAARLAADPATSSVARERAQRLAKRLYDDRLLTRANNLLIVPGAHWFRRAR